MILPFFLTYQRCSARFLSKFQDVLAVQGSHLFISMVWTWLADLDIWIFIARWAAGYDISMSRGIEERKAVESTLEGHTGSWIEAFRWGVYWYQSIHINPIMSGSGHTRQIKYDQIRSNQLPICWYACLFWPGNCVSQPQPWRLFGVAKPTTQVILREQRDNTFPGRNGQRGGTGCRMVAALLVEPIWFADSQKSRT